MSLEEQGELDDKPVTRRVASEYKRYQGDGTVEGPELKLEVKKFREDLLGEKDPVRTDLIFLESNMRPILALLSKEFVANNAFGTDSSPEAIRRTTLHIRKVLSMTAADVERQLALEDPSGVTWEGPDEGAAREERNTATKEFVNAVMTSVRKHIDLMPKVSAPRTFDDETKTMQKVIQKAYDLQESLGKAKAEIELHRSRVDGLLRTTDGSSHKIASLRNEIQKCKSALNGLDETQIEMLMEKVKDLEDENDYLYHRAFVADVVAGRPTTHRLMEAANPSPKKSKLVTARLKVKALERVVRGHEVRALELMDFNANLSRNNRPAYQQRALGYFDEAAETASTHSSDSGSEGDKPRGTLKEKLSQLSISGSFRDLVRPGAKKHAQALETAKEVTTRLVAETVDRIAQVEDAIDQVVICTSGSLEEVSAKAALRSLVANAAKAMQVEKNNIIKFIKSVCEDNPVIVSKWSFVKRNSLGGAGGAGGLASSPSFGKPLLPPAEQDDSERGVFKSMSASMKSAGDSMELSGSRRSSGSSTPSKASFRRATITAVSAARMAPKRSPSNALPPIDASPSSRKATAAETSALAASIISETSVVLQQMEDGGKEDRLTRSAGRRPTAIIVDPASPASAVQTPTLITVDDEETRESGPESSSAAEAKDGTPAKKKKKSDKKPSGKGSKRTPGTPAPKKNPRETLPARATTPAPKSTATSPPQTTNPPDEKKDTGPTPLSQHASAIARFLSESRMQRQKQAETCDAEVQTIGQTSSGRLTIPPSPRGSSKRTQGTQVEKGDSFDLDDYKEFDTMSTQTDVKETHSMHCQTHIKTKSREMQTEMNLSSSNLRADDSRLQAAKQFLRNSSEEDAKYRAEVEAREAAIASARRRQLESAASLYSGESGTPREDAASPLSDDLRNTNTPSSVVFDESGYEDLTFEEMMARDAEKEKQAQQEQLEAVQRAEAEAATAEAAAAAAASDVPATTAEVVPPDEPVRTPLEQSGLEAVVPVPKSQPVTPASSALVAPVVVVSDAVTPTHIVEALAAPAAAAEKVDEPSPPRTPLVATPLMGPLVGRDSVASTPRPCKCVRCGGALFCKLCDSHSFMPPVPKDHTSVGTSTVETMVAAAHAIRGVVEKDARLSRARAAANMKLVVANVTTRRLTRQSETEYDGSIEGMLARARRIKERWEERKHRIAEEKATAAKAFYMHYSTFYKASTAVVAPTASTLSDSGLMSPRQAGIGGTTPMYTVSAPQGVGTGQLKRGLLSNRLSTPAVNTRALAIGDRRAETPGQALHRRQINKDMATVKRRVEEFRQQQQQMTKVVPVSPFKRRTFED